MLIYANITLGWSPILAVVIDSARRVFQVTGWTGGTGTAPATGLYVGATGFVVDIADAIDIRGSAGATGATGAGVVTGGTANQALTKIDSTDYNTQWSTIDKTFVGLGNVPNTDATNATNISSGTLPNARIVSLPIANQSYAANTIAANNTGSTAAPSAFTFKQAGEQTYAGTITWNGTPPSGSSSIVYRWSQIGNTVTLNISAVYASAGTTNTNVTFTLPSDCPSPAQPTGLTSAGQKIYPALGYIDATIGGNPPTCRAALFNNAANNGFEIIITSASQSAKLADVTVIYFTN